MNPLYVLMFFYTIKSQFPRFHDALCLHEVTVRLRRRRNCHSAKFFAKKFMRNFGIWNSIYVTMTISIQSPRLRVALCLHGVTCKYQTSHKTSLQPLNSTLTRVILTIEFIICQRQKYNNENIFTRLIFFNKFQFVFSK